MRSDPAIKTLLPKHINIRLFLIAFLAGLLILLLTIALKNLQTKVEVITKENKAQTATIKEAKSKLHALETQDQYVRNQKLQAEITNIEKVYKQAEIDYEKLLDLKVRIKDTSQYDRLFALTLSLLSQRDFASASATLQTLNAGIEKENQTLASSFSIPANTPVNNKPPNSGYQRQQVQSDVGTFLVDIITADLNSTRVIIDTAANGDCKDNCPVLSLGDYASRNGAYAGVNGSYFCPASYPSCAGKTNSFDTLLMNKNKVYFNSDNNVYSSVPVAVFGSNWARFIGRSLDWGRDTGVDAVIANQPLLLSGGNIVFGGDGDPKKGSKGNRSFVAATGSTGYIGVVYNATVAEVAHTLHTLGISDALNLDSGGSTAFWYSGSYKTGPGRNIPNAVLFLRK